MSTIKNLYNLLQINNKIKDMPIRMKYLKDVWGLDQPTIAILEECSQSHVSNQIKKANGFVSRETFIKETDIIWTVDEIRYIQFLPREIIKDIEVIAFVNNILGLEVYHPFYQHFEHTVNMRIGALGNMGIMVKHIQNIFGKSQTNTSMVIKRYKERINMERPNRYDTTAKFSIGLQKRKTHFLLAGGQDV